MSRREPRRLNVQLARAACCALALSLSTGGAESAPPEDRISQRLAEPYPGYARDCGYPILFQPTRHISTARLDRRLGPVITLDPSLLLPGQGPHRRFLIAHECAHIKLSHTTRRGLRERRKPGGIRNQELSADCHAAESLVRAGLREDVRTVVVLLYRKGLYSPGFGYPAGVQRASIILHCLKAEGRSTAGLPPIQGSGGLVRHRNPVLEGHRHRP